MSRIGLASAHRSGMSEYSEYKKRVRVRLVELISESVTGWGSQDIEDAADTFIGRGFGNADIGETGRVVANALRKIRPIDSFEEAKKLAGLLNINSRDLAAGFTVTDPEPHFCAHCGGRFTQRHNRRTMYTPHTTVFDPRDV